MKKLLIAIFLIISLALIFLGSLFLGVDLRAKDTWQIIIDILIILVNMINVHTLIDIWMKL